MEDEVQVAGRSVSIEVDPAALKNLVPGVTAAGSVRVKRHGVGGSIDGTNRELETTLLHQKRRAIGVL